jgi:Secretion system C-terminal sorting domain
MKRFLQKTMMLLLVILLGVGSITAQTTVGVNVSAAWTGYMNVFDLSNNYIFGQGWGVSELKTTTNVAGNKMRLQPNFNGYTNAVASGNAGEIAFWTNGAGDGNKNMEALTFIENNSLIGQTVTFTGMVDSNTLSAGYTAVAFVKALDPAAGYSAVVNQTTPLTPGVFSVAAMIPATTGLIVQYGFRIYGKNGNPVNETALGKVVVGPLPLPLTDTVTVNGAGAWNGYMIVSDLGGNYIFDQSWGVPELKTTVNASANTVTLQPNFNGYANAIASGNAVDIAFWTNGMGAGNRKMEALSYLESTTLGGRILKFRANVNTNTLDAAYTREAFIKVLDPANGYATVLNQTTALPASGVFEVMANIPATAGLLVQYGFRVVGINANPANEAALGSVVIGVIPTPVIVTNNVTIDATKTWSGYMNVTDLNNAPQFGSAWGLADVKTTLNTTTNTVKLQPNFNGYADAVANGDAVALAYWTDGAGGGNKLMDASSFVESTSLGGAPLTFSGVVNSNDLSSAYTSSIFIKVLDPANGYATIINQVVPMPASGPFTVSAVIPATPGLIVQYGFTVKGINANPANEAALGSIILGPSAPLAIHSNSLQGKVVNDAVVLNWLSADEADTKNYIVEKSTNQKDFTALQSVNTKGSNETYTAIDDTKSESAVVFYRIKEVLNNATYLYSNIISINTPQLGMQLLPNPAQNNITIYTNSASAKTVSIYNAFGKLMNTITIASYSKTIDISTYAAGIYIVKMNNNISLQFIKK